MHRPLRKILYIDDDEDLLEMVKLSLEEVGGYTVIVCADGLEGVRLASDWQPDLILLDMNMPEMDGPATLHQLKNSAAAHIPVVFLSASRCEEYLSLGAAGTLKKPFDPMLLAGQVAELWHSVSIYSGAFAL